MKRYLFGSSCAALVSWSVGLSQGSWSKPATATELATTVSTNATSLQDVYAILCFSGKDPRAEFTIDKLREKGYIVITPNCDDVFKSKPYLWGLRMQRYEEEIAKLPEGSTAVLLDAFDMVVHGSASEAKRRFQQFGSPFVVSCTVAQYPGTEGRCPAQLYTPSPYDEEVEAKRNIHYVHDRCIYPCGGGLMGTKHGLLSLYRGNKYRPSDDDQCWLHEVTSQLKPGSEWALDHEKYLWLEYQSVRYINHFNVPMFVHMDAMRPDLNMLKKVYQDAQKYGLLFALKALSNYSAPALRGGV